MSKSRQLGFLEYQATDQSFFELFDRLRRERMIPDVRTRRRTRRSGRS